MRYNPKKYIAGLLLALMGGGFGWMVFPLGDSTFSVGANHDDDTQLIYNDPNLVTTTGMNTVLEYFSLALGCYTDAALLTMKGVYEEDVLRAKTAKDDEDGGQSDVRDFTLDPICVDPEVLTEMTNVPLKSYLARLQSRVQSLHTPAKLQSEDEVDPSDEFKKVIQASLAQEKAEDMEHTPTTFVSEHYLAYEFDLLSGYVERASAAGIRPRQSANDERGYIYEYLEDSKLSAQFLQDEVELYELVIFSSLLPAFDEFGQTYLQHLEYLRMDDSFSEMEDRLTELSRIADQLQYKLPNSTTDPNKNK